MKKLFKTLILIIVVLILLFIIAVACLIGFLDPNKFKGQISAIVHEKTGRDLVINGKIERSFFPWLGLRIHDVRMTNAPGFEPQDNFVSVGEADISVRLFPLLSGNVEIGKIGLKDLQLNLAKNKQGQTNWQGLGNRGAVMAPKNDQVASNSVTVTHAGGEIQNVTTETHAEGGIQNTTTVTHTGGGILGKTSINVKGHGPSQFSVKTIEISNANILWLNEKDNQTLQLKHLNLSSENMGLNKTFPLSLKFVLQTNTSALSGEYALDSNITLNPQQDNYQFDKLRFSAALAGKSLPPTQLQAEKVALKIKQNTLSITNALITAANLTAKTNVQATNILSKPQFNGRVEVAQFNLKDFLKAFGKNMNTQDPEALTRASVSANFTGNSASLKFSSVLGQLDDSTIQGTINITNFAEKAVNFAFNMNQLNLDRYLPASAAPPTASTGTAAVSSAFTANANTSKDPEKYAALRQANISGSMQLGSLILSKTQLTQVVAKLSLKGGGLQINPLTANVFQGTTYSQIAANLRAATPSVTVDEKLTNVQVNQLTKSDRLTGTANVTAHLVMQGEDKNAILRSLNGTTEFNIQNGALLGVDLPYELNRAAAMIKRQGGASQPNTSKTDFGQFSGTGTFQNGVFHNNDLLLRSPQIKITGNGTANLVTNALDYHLAAQEFNNPVFGQTALPLLVTGTFSKPIITPDIEAVARTLLKSGIKTKLGEHLGGTGVGGLLNQLLQ